MAGSTDKIQNPKTCAHTKQGYSKSPYHNRCATCGKLISCKLNIIEAIQASKDGYSITSDFLMAENFFIKHIKNGHFYQYKIVNNKAEYRYEVIYFNMRDILSSEWEIVEKDYFTKQK